MAFELPELPYEKNALEPHIDAKTMEVHHDKHHAGYTSKLNDALDDADSGKSIEEILKNVSQKSGGVRNNGGGYYNHSLFWEIMGPNCGGSPSGEVSEAIDSAFGSYNNFKEKFKEKATGQFGSGWAWLIVNGSGNLEVCNTPNQDNPLMDVAETNGTPILGLDVWEHAYYLKYQNKRPDYVEAFFNVINWEEVNKRYEAAKS